MIEEAEASRITALFMREIATAIQPSFPHYAYAILDEIQRKPTVSNDRWNNVAAVLSSLGAVPGVALRSHEHARRNLALSAVVLAQKMAELTFGGRKNVRDKVRFVEWLIEDMRSEVEQCTALAKEE